MSIIEKNRKFKRDESQDNPTSATGNRVEKNKDFDLESEAITEKKDKK